MAKKRTTMSVSVPENRPGQYGMAMPPDREAERQYVAAEIAQQRGLDGMAANILDNELDAKLRHWNADIGQAYEQRVSRLKEELSAVDNTVVRQEKELVPKREDCERTKSNLDRAYSALVNGTAYVTAKPLSAAVTQDLALLEVPSQPSSDVDPSRRFAGEGQLPGGPMFGDAVHYGVLSLAVIADFVAFYQVLALLLGLYPQLLYSIVIAVTLIALIVMHKAGTTLREIRRRAPSGRLWVATACLVTWAALGAVAFWLRLEVKDDTGGSTSLLNFGGAVVGQDDTSAGIKALVFLIIYLTTGVVALVGAYLRHNPLRTEYLKARRLHHKLSAILLKAEEALNSERKRKAALEQRIESEPGLRDRALEQRKALTCELKAYTRTLVARRLDHPADVEHLLSQPIPGCTGGRHVAP